MHNCLVIASEPFDYAQGKLRERSNLKEGIASSLLLLAMTYYELCTPLKQMGDYIMRGFRFWFKKKEPLKKGEPEQKAKDGSMSEKMKEVVRPKAPASGRRRKVSFFKYIFIILLLFILAAAVFVTFAPKYVPGIVDNPVFLKISRLLPFMRQEAEEDFSFPEEQPIEELVTVRTYRTMRGDFIDILPAMGTIKGDKEVELRFSVNGIVDSINFFEGDLLRKGDIVATLEQKDALLKLEYSKSKYKTQKIAKKAAGKKVEMHKKLYDDGIIIKPKLEEVQFELESVQSQVESAQKEVEFALAELDKTYLYSPLDSVMGTRDVEVGEFVTSNVKVATLYDTSTVLAEVGIIEKDINRIALGQKAKISVDTYPGVEFEGQIENIAPIVEGKSRTLTAQIRIKNDNPKGTLLPGMFARIWISVYEKKNTIKLPSSCFYDLDNNGEFDSVYVVDDENIAHAVPVKIGYVSTDYVEVIDGLREGEQVVSESMAELKDSVRVDVIEVQEAIF